MKIYQYKDYKDYVDWQTKINKIKVDWLYAREHAIENICKDKGRANFIICHGTRNGGEMKLFLKRFPNAYIIGTEISDNAYQFEHTVQHDFTIPKEEWIGKADLVYSNSFDHTIDPEKTIQTWRDQLNYTGTMYLEYNQGQSIGNESDPLDATIEEVEKLIIDNGLNILRKFIGSQGSDVLVCERKNND